MEVWPQRGFDGRRVFHTHERAIASPEKKLCVDQGAEQRVARCGIKSPQTARLRLRESQSRHLEEFTLNAIEHFVGRAVWHGRHGLLLRFARDAHHGATRVPQRFSTTRGPSGAAFQENRRDPKHRRFAAVARDTWVSPAGVVPVTERVGNRIRPSSKTGCPRTCIWLGHD
jgi:hypothetical protein